MKKCLYCGRGWVRGNFHARCRKMAAEDARIQEQLSWERMNLPRQPDAFDVEWAKQHKTNT